MISIHSAARAETQRPIRRHREEPDFNPLRREGGDIRLMMIFGWPCNFNPLRREGGDTMVKISCTGIGISIHSAARAETGQIAQDLDELQFQSTPPRGRRRGDQIKFTALYRDFNPLRREGGDEYILRLGSVSW